MDNSASKAPETPVAAHEALRPARNESAPKQEVSKEIREAADLGVAAFETIGLDESAETTGRVSEVLSNIKEDSAGGGGGSKARAKQIYDAAAIKNRLLSALPSEKAMFRQVEREIKNEIDYLHKKAMKMMASPGKVSYFEMQNLLKKIRELTGILADLVKASYDGLKTLWLRYVHGVM